jgi:hypothetical protein
VSKKKHNIHEEGKTPLRDRIWETTFEWAKKELGTNNKNAREIANAGVKQLDSQAVTSR